MSDQKYYTVGPPSLPENPRNFWKEQIDNKTHVRVFLSTTSAAAFRDERNQALSTNEWESLKILALQMESCKDKIPFMYLETPSGNITTFKSISINDWLK